MKLLSPEQLFSFLFFPTPPSFYVWICVCMFGCGVIQVIQAFFTFFFFKSIIICYYFQELYCIHLKLKYRSSFTVFLCLPKIYTFCSIHTVKVFHCIWTNFHHMGQTLLHFSFEVKIGYFCAKQDLLCTWTTAIQVWNGISDITKFWMNYPFK